MSDDPFHLHRPTLLSLAYRMLGDMARAEDMVQESWVSWNRRSRDDIDSPKAFLLTTVTHLCLDELGSARVRREEARGDRLPEPVDLAETGIDRVETLDRISMAFLVLLQRLTPAERAVFLLHEVFDMSHAEIAALLDKTDAACRQLLSRARENVTSERRVLESSRDEHRRLLAAFVTAINGGEQEPLVDLLATDAVFIADNGPDGGRFGRVRHVGRPVVGQKKIAALVSAIGRQSESPVVDIREHVLNGEPAIVAFVDGKPRAAIFVSVADGLIRHVFLQADPARLRHIGALRKPD